MRRKEEIGTHIRARARTYHLQAHIDIYEDTAKHTHTHTKRTQDYKQSFVKSAKLLHWNGSLKPWKARIIYKHAYARTHTRAHIHAQGGRGCVRERERCLVLSRS